MGIYENDAYKEGVQRGLEGKSSPSGWPWCNVGSGAKAADAGWRQGTSQRLARETAEAAEAKAKRDAEPKRVSIDVGGSDSTGPATPRNSEHEAFFSKVDGVRDTCLGVSLFAVPAAGFVAGVVSSFMGWDSTGPVLTGLLGLLGGACLLLWLIPTTYLVAWLVKLTYTSSVGAVLETCVILFAVATTFKWPISEFGRFWGMSLAGGFLIKILLKPHLRLIARVWFLVWLAAYAFGLAPRL